MFRFSVETEDAGLVKFLSEAAEKYTASTPPAAAVASETSAGVGKADPKLVREIVEALSYAPLNPPQYMALKIWAAAPSWVPISALHQRLVNDGIAANPLKAAQVMKSNLGGFGIRVTQKVTDPAIRAKKLAALVDVQFSNGATSHKLTLAGREAVQVLNL